MTAAEFKIRMDKLFTSQYKAAAALGVTQPAIVHWLQGRRPVPRYVEIILKCIEENADKPGKEA